MVRVALAADLTVRDDVEARVVLRPREVLGRHAPQLLGPDPGREATGELCAVDQPIRLGEAADERGREQRKSLHGTGLQCWSADRLVVSPPPPVGACPGRSRLTRRPTVRPRATRR